ncbi:lytic transglycosylase F [Pseudomonas sp. TCU-HL1]|uniref:transglycosylase SLT domain-containing protein n=1 Tax=Pseudomonas sp. TCU-HL1 TaxID=1856685 RepID=UPI000857102A|nr:lytic transglycosylase F [Pseudomonas sp. TCU-HL1]AOE84064.1 lytic transglycosylase [Pseudomonas sp. TCU-HL1]
MKANRWLYLFLVLAVSLPAAWAQDLPSVELSAAEEAEVDAMVLPVPPARKVDFDGMRKSRLVRILVPYSKTFYAVDRGRQQGISYELGKALESWLNQRYPFESKSLKWRVLFIPTARDQLLPKLVEGVGDIAAGGLTITRKRLETVDFAEPFAKGIREALVTGPNAAKVEKLEDMAGMEVMVRPSSSYFEHLTELNESFRQKGLAPIQIRPADENLESEDILEMVNVGLVNATVVDRYIAEAWSPMLESLVIHDAFYIRDDSEFAWAVRKDSPAFLDVLSGFAKTHKIGTTFGNILHKKYVKNSKALYNATTEEELKRFAELVGFFEKHATTYDFDYLMLMAQGFQESQLNQDARSHRGAVGIMQLLPSTAADPGVGISGIDKSADRNIEAGSKYMRLLADKYLNDPELTKLNRTLMSFAAYNAGPGNLRKFRRLAEKSGLDKNIWFGNVEQAAARIVGRETVDYVGNIYKYYVAYKLAQEKQRLRAKGG